MLSEMPHRETRRETSRERSRDTMKIVAIDPGGTTGVCEYDTESEEMFQSQIGPDKHHKELYQLLQALYPDVVVCERFNYQRRELDKGVSLVLVSREYIGVCELWTQTNEVPLAMQQPSCMKLFPDYKLKRIGIYRPGMVHANDATCHLLYYMTVNMKSDKWTRAAREPE